MAKILMREDKTVSDFPGKHHKTNDTLWEHGKIRATCNKKWRAEEKNMVWEDAIWARIWEMRRTQKDCTERRS